MWSRVHPITAASAFHLNSGQQQSLNPTFQIQSARGRHTFFHFTKLLSIHPPHRSHRFYHYVDIFIILFTLTSLLQLCFNFYYKCLEVSRSKFWLPNFWQSDKGQAPLSPIWVSSQKESIWGQKLSVSTHCLIQFLFDPWHQAGDSCTTNEMKIILVSKLMHLVFSIASGMWFTYM